MPIIVGIDGTGGDLFPGTERNERYDQVFANSFVNRICFPETDNKRYFRGPVLLGGGLMQAIADGYSFILPRARATDSVLLTGYSRGAAGVVVIAQRLQRQNVNVRAMLLFDCVDRHIGIDASEIPNNVRYVMHVMRSPEAGSRESFGNAALRSNPPTARQEALFHCTHGGMGGVPWPVPQGQLPNDYIDEGVPDGRTNVTYAQDARGSERVWGYVRQFMDEHGFEYRP